jgi:hypothetical protein
MNQERQAAGTHGTVGLIEYAFLGIGAWRLVSLGKALAEPLRFVVFAALLFAIAVAYALLKPGVMSLVVKAHAPRRSLGQQLSTLRRDALCLLAGITPAYAFFTWSETWLPTDPPNTLEAVAVLVGTIALFVGGYWLGYWVDKALSGSDRNRRA